MVKQKFKLIIIVVIINSFFYTAINLFLPCRFQANDDVMMAWIASGVYTGVPDAHLVYINYLYGAVVAFLYKIIPSVEWYTLFFAIIHVLSSSIVIVFLYGKTWKDRKFLCIMCVIVFYLIYVRSIIYLQFTTVSAICAIAGLLLISSTRYSILGVLAFLLASLVRFEAAMMVGLVYALFYPKLFLTNQTSWKQFTKLAVTFVLAVGINVIDRYIYASEPQWAEYRSYNKARAISDNPLFRVIEVKEIAGISNINLSHALAFTIDESVVTESQLLQASKLVLKQSTFSQECNLAILQLKRPTYLRALILLLLYSLIVAMSEKNNLLKAVSFLPCVIVVIMMFTIASVAYLKYRVFLGLVLSTFVFTSVFTSKRVLSHMVTLSVCCSLALWVLLWGKPEIECFANEYSGVCEVMENQALFKKVAAMYPNTLSLIGVGVEDVNAWNVTNDVFCNHIEAMGWMAKWPTHTQLHSHKDIVTNQIVLCADVALWKNIGSSFVESIKYNYGMDTESQLLFEAGGYVGFILKEKTEN